MKKYLLLLATFATTHLFAQSSGSDNYLGVSYLGYSNGQYKIQVDSKQSSCNVDVVINWDNDTHISNVSPNANGSLHYNRVVGSSTVFFFTGTYNPHAKFNILALTICDWHGNNPTQIGIDISYFILTPIILDYFKGNKTDEGLMLTWKTSMEQNVEEFQIQHQVNSTGPWLTLQTIKPKGPSVYAISINSSLKASGIMGFVILAVLIGFFFQRKKYLTACIIMFTCVIACTKSNINSKDNKANLKGTYRLVTKDIDGQLSYSQILQF
jgi:hypothetical protein